jgi:ribosomal protein S18 acetylase RimI-like enzyme
MVTSILPESRLQISEPHSFEEWAAVKQLFLDYAKDVAQPLCFQGFDIEIENIAHIYSPPHGAVFLATVDNIPAGCVAYRPLPETDHVNPCEMKRLYVSPAFRGLGLGHQLVYTVMDSARISGYSCVLLDTLSEMEAARALYEEIGFIEIPPYLHSPTPGAHHLKLLL